MEMRQIKLCVCDFFLLYSSGKQTYGFTSKTIIFYENKIKIIEIRDLE